MKKYLIFAIAILFGTTVMAQQPHQVEFTVNEIVQYHHNQLTFCDFDSITGVIIQRDTTNSKPVVWIDANQSYTFGEYITITEENDGELLYIEMDSIINLNDGIFHYFQNSYIIMDDNGNYLYCDLENFHPDTLQINLVENDMPAPYSHDYWLSEGVNQILRPTPEDEGYIYVWESDNWGDSIYQNYELQIHEPGYYLCNLWDQCLHYSMVEYFVNYAPSIKYVTTNLSNVNELHWTVDPRNDYDTVAILRDFNAIAFERYETGIWTDTINNEYGSPLYTLKPVKNGVIVEGRSKHKSGVSLSLHHVYQETIDISFYGPDQEGTSLGEYIQYYQLYSVEHTGWGLIHSMIPIDVNDLNDIENIYDTLILAAVTFEGEEIYSNMIFPHAGITKCDENTENNISIYPNPTNGILKFSASINAEYKIFDVQGRIVKNGIVQPQINVSDLAKGVYTIQVYEAEKPFTRKFIRE